jgi:hypothetical protein
VDRAAKPRSTRALASLGRRVSSLVGITAAGSGGAPHLRFGGVRFAVMRRPGILCAGRAAARCRIFLNRDVADTLPARTTPCNTSIGQQVSRHPLFGLTAQWLSVCCPDPSNFHDSTFVHVQKSRCGGDHTSKHFGEHGGSCQVSSSGFPRGVGGVARSTNSAGRILQIAIVFASRTCSVTIRDLRRSRRAKIALCVLARSRFHCPIR